MVTSAFLVLESTLAELISKRIRSDENSRFDECVTVIRACMELIPQNPGNGEYALKIRQALAELINMTHQGGEFVIAARLKVIEHELASATARARHRVA